MDIRVNDILEMKKLGFNMLRKHIKIEPQLFYYYCDKYGIKFPEEEEAFWAGVHKAICNLFLMENTSVTIDQYNESYNWLAERSYSPLINNTGGEK